MLTKYAEINDDEELLKKLNQLDEGIGMLEFNCKEEILPFSIRFRKVGNFELDIIVVDQVSNHVIMLDHDEPDFVMCYCASDIRAFIKAINHFYNHVNSTGYDCNDEAKIMQIVETSTFIAGHREYKWFYQMMVGI